MTQSDSELTDKIDKALKEYYASFDRKDYKTLHDDKLIGKFKKYMEENGFGDSDIKDELDMDAEDCVLVEFDNDENGTNLFPFNQPIEVEAAKRSEILRILKIIVEKGQYIPPKQTLSVTKKELIEMAVNINNQEVDGATAKYLHQMKYLGKNFEKDGGLLYFFGVNEKSGMPFITYMVDSYTRDKAKHFTKDSDLPLSVKEWSANNPFMQALQKKDPKTKMKLEKAIKTYGNRIMTRLHFTPTIKINDNLLEICEYIASIPAFIRKLIEAQHAIPPFQIDLLIAVKKVKGEVNKNEEDGDDDDDDDDDDEEEDETETKTMDLEADRVGAVKQNLADFPVAYVAKEDDDEETQSAIEKISRIHTQKYHDFRTVLSKWDKQHPNDGDDGDDNDYPQRRNFDPKTYPQNRRFVVFVDRREKIQDDDGKDDNKEAHKDEVIYFQPPNNCNSIDNDHVPEFGFELIRKCLIPIRANNGDIMNITATDHLNGQLLTFMFNVEQKDEIKCYIVWNGQTMRFHGEHMLQVLPHLFVDTKENIQFVTNSEQAKKLETFFNERMEDLRFNRFYHALH